MVPKYGENVKPCYMDTDSLVYHIKTEDFYADIDGDVKKKFDTSGYDKTDSRPLPIGLNKKVIGLMKDGLGGKIMTEFVPLRAKICAYRKIIYTVEFNKVALNKNDDKRTVKKDGISTLARSHSSLSWNSLLGYISLS